MSKRQKKPEVTEELINIFREWHLDHISDFSRQRSKSNSLLLDYCGIKYQLVYTPHDDVSYMWPVEETVAVI